jgi:photoactive yellow protein
METVQFTGVDLAELLPRIPGEIKNGLPFGLVKLDLQGTILEYNMAEGDLTGVDPKWAIGKNFFDDVALCTKTQAFYGRFVEGVKKGFLNTVFDYVFDHRDEGVRVKVHMVTVPDHLGRKSVMLLVRRLDAPVVVQAVPEWKDTAAQAPAQMPIAQPAAVQTAPAAAGAAQPSIRDIVEAVVAILNQGGGGSAQQIAERAAAQLGGFAPAPAPVQAPAPVPAPAASKPKHEDIFKL